MSSPIKRKLANITNSSLVLPVLAEMTAQAGGSPKAFAQVALLTLWQLDSVIQDNDTDAVLWHGTIELRDDGLLFCSKIMLPTGKSTVPLEKIANFFDAYVITNSVYRGRLWKIGCNFPLPQVRSAWPQEGSYSVSDGLQGILTVIKNLKQDMAGITQEMFMTNQGVMAMVEEMGLWLDSDGSRQEMSQLLAERLEANRVLIERLREKERALQHADRLATLGRLVAGVAHEINNPLAFIKMNTELLSLMLTRHCEQDPTLGLGEVKYKRPIEAIFRGVERIASIVSGLKFFSRQEQREKTGVSLAKCLEDAWTLVNSNKELSGTVDMKARIGNDLMIYGNAQQLEQVLINLLHNALKAVHKGMPQQGVVIVSACQEIGEMEWVVLTVADNGCGISQSTISKIFEPFYTSDDEHGTGLGLSIVQGIVQEHGGNIGVMSIVGQGTTFTIRLPAWQLQEGDK